MNAQTIENHYSHLQAISDNGYHHTDRPIATSLGPGLLIHFNVKIANTDFQIWHLISWQHSCQPIRSHVRKSLLTNMDFNMDFA